MRNFVAVTEIQSVLFGSSIVKMEEVVVGDFPYLVLLDEQDDKILRIRFFHGGSGREASSIHHKANFSNMYLSIDGNEPMLVANDWIRSERDEITIQFFRELD